MCHETDLTAEGAEVWRALSFICPTIDRLQAVLVCRIVMLYFPYYGIVHTYVL
jgi:hypothetical protein